MAEVVQVVAEAPVVVGGGRAIEVAFDLFNALNAENRFVSGPSSNSPTTGNQLFNGNPNVGVPDSQVGEPRSAQVRLRFRF